MAFVEFQDVTKYYQMGEQKIAAADGVTFSIEKGEFTVIVGPSGAGKTTVLNMLGGMGTRAPAGRSGSTASSSAATRAASSPITAATTWASCSSSTTSCRI